ncbi:DUF1850 domain-containing protein [Halobacillus sp. A5]|uniref:DUF1850 domain-containing protein n=1 Tax=Halobacillus sp. A5 TaxID=2880263 RepID=UPI0020A67EBD|nr:DUF1850 domain-containing protein [Halobacillus sp. A5]MCP3026805.1 DUF1850 domain-containing protein [Halobacillus sp. A5]
MKHQKFYLIIIGISLAAVVLAVVWAFYPYRSVITFEPIDRQGSNAYMPITETEHFKLKFTHSVHLSDVVEEYEVREGRLYPVQMIYEDTAIGMPSNAEEGETFEVKDGKYYISDLNGFHESINLSIGQVRADHTIIYKEKSYLLKDILGAGSFIRIVPQHVSNWELMRGETLDE